ncbi:YjjG family noncanonical pyrimidine nucleotidase [Robertkochia aurantiaca]|uniref:YjjG family noncanonical pyrimidine nucleotidase n=1 Tax=Robertkochia aurantiaca TaxID=2873700 RepID=UPI001CCDD2C1|nr:YjjG family noncanonical pyrimidine nucleotidase [Robertkochia sp. 3YJGBD-33]
MIKERGKVTDVFFDLDHTLWDFERNSALTFARILPENAIELELEIFLREYVPANLKFWRMFREDRITKDELRHIRLKTVFDKLNYKIDNRKIKKIANDYLTYLPTFNHLFSDAEEILNYLKETYRLHIITNGFAAVQKGKLINSGIDHFFDIVVNSEMAGVKKPNPYIFHLALKKAAVRPESAVMIGDSLEADVLGALSVGMQAVYYNSKNETAPDGIIEIKRLTDIKTIL